VRLGYPRSIVDALPDRAIGSFAGVGNPFALRPLRRRVRHIRRRRPGAGRRHHLGRLFGVAGAGLGVLLGSEVVVIAGLVLYLYVAEPLISSITALGLVAAYLPGVAADGLTQASQAGVRLLPVWQGGLVFTAWAVASAAAGTVMTARRDIT